MFPHAKRTCISGHSVLGYTPPASILCLFDACRPFHRRLPKWSFTWVPAASVHCPPTFCSVHWLPLVDVLFLQRILAALRTGMEIMNDLWTVRTGSLLVVGIPHTTSLQEINEYFSRWGVVRSLIVNADITAPGLADYAFVYYSSYAEVSAKFKTAACTYTAVPPIRG
ncbi:unnamed protein product [Gongylonema pulchrum]|uniref:RRM domain-containing protein n=1 Tax=Gongylonema pulchrum TaxID=637853 RepID=A0A183EU09_9BILA|nr:unnamed protein product [Gongylonema pulchrum]